MRRIGLFSKKKIENRAAEVGFEDTLLRAALSDVLITKEMALQIPTVQGCINKIAGTVTRLPIRLYQKEEDGKVTEISDDNRLRLLNDDTGDTLDSNNFWRAMIEDYYLGKGAFAYICKEKGHFKSINYVDESRVTVITNQQAVFKDFNIIVDAESFLPYEFLRILRKTKDGATSIPIQEEIPLILSVAYNSLIFEDHLVRKGGNKKGFLLSKNRLAGEVLKEIREAWRKLYSNEYDNIVVLNEGMDFKESSNTSVEMQLNENKVSNANEICKTFGFAISILTGGATNNDQSQFVSCITDLLTAIETALDKALLLEREKANYYFAFDTKELTRGNVKERFDAYAVAIEKNFMQIDEVRKHEDLPPLGFNFIKLGLGDVFVNPKTMEVYTPNTNETTSLSKNGAKNIEPTTDENDLKNGGNKDIIDLRANPNHDEKGRFASGDCKYYTLLLPKAEYARVYSEIGTHYSRYEGKSIATIKLSNSHYVFENLGFGYYNIFDKY